MAILVGPFDLAKLPARYAPVRGPRFLSPINWHLGSHSAPHVDKRLEITKETLNMALQRSLRMNKLYGAEH
jgi:hypothetical protein